MLTFFTTAKPFRGHINVIQRNALRSWTLLHPDVEVILFGDDEGAAETARELGIRHEPEVERTEFGAMRLDSMFGKAQAMARHDVLCYVNCDIILMRDFLRALELVRSKYKRFLMVGRRWDTPITAPIDFSDAGWAERVRALALSTKAQRGEWWIDYFGFPRGLWTEMPPLGVGRLRWDNWLIWGALEVGAPIVDASRGLVAVHQNHDYGHHPQGETGVWQGEEAKRNLALAGGWEHLRTINDATRRMTARGQIRGNWMRRRQRGIRKAWRGCIYAGLAISKVWYWGLKLSYHRRRILGLNRAGMERLRARFAGRGSHG